jgi:hypothetical protein
MVKESPAVDDTNPKAKRHRRMTIEFAAAELSNTKLGEKVSGVRVQAV